MRVNLRIDHLVLEGVELTPRERARFQQALEVELGRLLGASAAGVAAGETPGPTHNHALESVRPAPVALAPGWDGASLGRQVARAVYGGLPR
jgi:hypothetical protein